MDARAREPPDRSREHPQVRAARKLAWWLDGAIPIPGTSWRVGLDPILGLLPGIGDAIGGVLSAYVILVAARLGAPTPVLARMALNAAIDALVGSVPLLGDAFDVAWRANTRNLALLDAWLERPRDARRRSAGVVVAAAVVVLAVAAAVAWSAWSLVAWAVRSR